MSKLGIHIKHMLCIVSLVYLSGISWSSQAGLLYEQSPLATPLPVASGPAVFGIAPVADAFALASDVSVEQLEFYSNSGLSATFGPLMTAVLDIRIYASDGLGLPDLSTLFLELTAETGFSTSLVSSSGGLDLLHHSLTLAAPVDLPSGNYFIEISANAANGAAFGWQASANDGGLPASGAPQVLLIPGFGAVPQDPAANMAFSLLGAITGVIPAPGILWLFVGGLLLLPWSKRKHAI